MVVRALGDRLPCRQCHRLRRRPCPPVAPRRPRPRRERHAGVRVRGGMADAGRRPGHAPRCDGKPALQRSHGAARAAHARGRTAARARAALGAVGVGDAAAWLSPDRPLLSPSCLARSLADRDRSAGGLAAARAGTLALAHPGAVRRRIERFDGACLAAREFPAHGVALLVERARCGDAQGAGPGTGLALHDDGAHGRARRLADAGEDAVVCPLLPQHVGVRDQRARGSATRRPDHVGAGRRHLHPLRPVHGRALDEAADARRPRA